MRLPFLGALLLAGALASQVAGAGAAGPTVEATSTGSGFAWSPSSASVAAGGAVAFRNPSSSVPHGVSWTGGPGEPACSGVPVDAEGTGWSGECTFSEPGTYSFVCFVHPTEMKGTITVGASAPGPPAPPGAPPPSGQPQPESPLRGGPRRALKLAKRQRGRTVRGSVALSAAGASARLEVALLAQRRALGGSRRGGRVRVGRLVRVAGRPGRAGFSVPLSGAGRRALRRLDRLSLTVVVVVKAPQGSAVTLKRGVSLHA